MKTCIGRITAVAVSLVCVTLLGGCAEAFEYGVSYGAEAVGARPTAADSDLKSFTLPHRITPTDFKDGVRAVAREKQYEVQVIRIMPSQSGEAVMVTLTRQRQGFTVFSRGWNIIVTVTLESDRKTVTVSPSVRGDGGPAVKDVADEFKTGLINKFS
ncbi:MAG: hypothetical protein ACYC75_00730 [Minisyncoccota bacterium]